MSFPRKAVAAKGSMTAEERWNPKNFICKLLLKIYDKCCFAKLKYHKYTSAGFLSRFYI
jgi:hypothetical protein